MKKGVADYATRIRLLDCSKLTVSWKNSTDFTIFRHDVIFKFLKFFCFSCQITGSSFMSISSLVLELWQLPCIRDWPEIGKSEIHQSEFCSISGDWEMKNLAWTSLIKCCWMLQNARVTAFTIAALLRKTNRGPKLPYAIPA